MTSRAMRRLRWIGAILIILATPVVARAQEATVTGTITDSTGGVLPGVSVSIANAETGVVQHVVTDAQGRFEVLYLNAGRYTVTAELSGFKKTVRGDLPVRVVPQRHRLILAVRNMDEGNPEFAL